MRIKSGEKNNMSQIEQFIKAAQEAIEAVKRHPGKTVQLFHHNDSDGLSSGAILKQAFERAGFTINRYCLEKPYPAVLEMVFKQEEGLIVFADFAGRIAPMISDLNRGRNLVLILDHHKASPATDPRVYNLDPELFGLKGDRDITASTTCYLFACTMDSANQDMAYIATIGAVGDEFFVDGRLASQNREVALETEHQGLLEIREHENGETYILKTPRGPVPCHQLGAYLDTLGAAGYYQNGPDMGIEVCLAGPSPASDEMLEGLRKIQDRVFKAEIDRIRAGALHQTPNLQWFHVQDRFKPMGVKMIGAFCDVYKDTDVFDPGKYIAGFMRIPDEIPGFGPITFNEVKISMRVAYDLQEEIRSGKAMGLDTFLPEATGRIGGFSDACHSLTAATTVAVGKEQALIDEMENILHDRSPTRTSRK